MLSTNQKAKMINNELYKRKQAPLIDKKLSDFNFTPRTFKELNKIDLAIRTYYGIKVTNAVIPLLGVLFINPVTIDEAVNRKFNELKLMGVKNDK